MNINFKLLHGQYTIVQFPPESEIPTWIQGDDFIALVRTRDELSIVCESELTPNDVRSDQCWRILKVDEILDFSLVGILAQISTILASEGVSIFVISTYNTDYLMIKDEQLRKAVVALQQAGHKVAGS
jgi:hypothetical protein